MKITFRDRVKYWFDGLMSKGTIALVAVLFLATAIVIIGVGIILAIIARNNDSLYYNFWVTAMHVIDPGTITGAETGNIPFLVLMTIATLCGIFVTSILIGIVNSAFEEKLNRLRKGNSRIIKDDHVVILGYDSNVITLIEQLIIANENHRNNTIVILSEEDKEDVETSIFTQIKDFKTTKIICRTGVMTDGNMLANCAIDTAKSIIINQQDDFMTLKTMITIENHFKTINKTHDFPNIVATINKEENREAMRIVSGGKDSSILVGDSIARIIAQSCRQPGLSTVMMELFDFEGDEFYFENFPELEGVSFGDVLNYFEKAVVFGFKRQGQIHLNPNINTILKNDDHLLLLMEDDGIAKPKPYKSHDVSSLCCLKQPEILPEDILIIGVNTILKSIITELDNYLPTGSNLYIADEVIPVWVDEITKDLAKINLHTIECDIENPAMLKKLTTYGANRILVLSDYETDSETSDAKTLFKLIHLRDITGKSKENFSITSEMKDTTNQQLAEITHTNDLVVGSNIINLILSQISENKDLSTVFDNLLGAQGSEIYIRDASNYVKLNTPMNFYEVTDLLKAKKQIAIGYKKQLDRGFTIVMNPNKNDIITFNKDDCIIALASD